MIQGLRFAPVCVKLGFQYQPTFNPTLAVRRDTSKPEVVWSARVSESSKNTFNHLIPIYGAQSWIIDSALEKFLAIVEARPSLKDQIDGIIHRHRFEETREGRLIEFSVKIRTGLYDRFNNIFPQMGATSWFMRALLDAVNTQLSDFILDERVMAAVRQIILENRNAEAEETHTQGHPTEDGE